MRTLITVSILLCVFLAGCGAGSRQTQHRGPGTAFAPVRAPFRINATLTSKLPDRYLVRSGPLETYRAYRVNERFRSKLITYVAAKSAGTSADTLDLVVTIEDLTTGYKQIGASLTDPSPNALAFVTRGDLVASASPFLAADAPGFLVSSGLDIWRGEGDTTLPQEVTKTATLTLAAEVRMRETVVRIRTFSLASTDTWHRDFDWELRAWVYDYTQVFHDVFAKGLVRIDEMIDEVVREPHAPGGDS